MTRFEWDETKNRINQDKHGVPFERAQYAFFDKCHVIIEDAEHSQDEQRFYCLGKVGGGILTVRFTYRNDVIRIFGAGYWRGGEKRYEQENKI